MPDSPYSFIAAHTALVACCRADNDRKSRASTIVQHPSHFSPNLSDHRGAATFPCRTCARLCARLATCRRNNRGVDLLRSHIATRLKPHHELKRWGGGGNPSHHASFLLEVTPNFRPPPISCPSLRLPDPPAPSPAPSPSPAPVS